MENYFLITNKCAFIVSALSLSLSLDYSWMFNTTFNPRLLFCPSEEIFHCEKTFERLFLGAIFGTNAPHFIAGWKADFKDQVS